MVALVPEIRSPLNVSCRQGNIERSGKLGVIISTVHRVSGKTDSDQEFHTLVKSRVENEVHLWEVKKNHRQFVSMWKLRCSGSLYSLCGSMANNYRTSQKGRVSPPISEIDERYVSIFLIFLSLFSIQPPILITQLSILYSEEFFQWRTIEHPMLQQQLILWWKFRSFPASKVCVLCSSRNISFPRRLHVDLTQIYDATVVCNDSDI